MGDDLIVSPAPGGDHSRRQKTRQGLSRACASRPWGWRPGAQRARCGLVLRERVGKGLLISQAAGSGGLQGEGKGRSTHQNSRGPRTAFSSLVFFQNYFLLMRQ